MYTSVKMFLQTTNNKNYKVPLKNHKSSVQDTENTFPINIKMTGL